MNTLQAPSLHPLRFAAAVVIVLAGGLGLTGCAQISALTASDESHQVASLIAGAQMVTRKTADEQRRELAAASDGFTRDRSTAARLRLALLLAQPGGTINDDARALSLLEPFSSVSGNDGPLTQFGSLLYAQVADRVREQRRAQQLKEQIDALRAVDRSLMERGQTRAR